VSFRQAARGQVILLLEGLDIDVEVLSFLILLVRNGSGLDRSSPKHWLRCLEGSRTEEILR